MNPWTDGTTLELGPLQIAFVMRLIEGNQLCEEITFACTKKKDYVFNRSAIGRPTSTPHLPENDIPMHDTPCSGTDSFTFTMHPDSPHLKEFNYLGAKGIGMENVIVSPLIYHNDSFCMEGLVVSMESTDHSFVFGINQEFESCIKSVLSNAFPGAR